ncbi:aminotransferase class I/II-fold pyridoxal phosphate-dependent enzyme [Streptomyces sp. NPDC049541]|uniref:aminotransferase class I/II-fold pyridoxal phosphate-dependent enzyme n=1 Tax=Streptomyces sp. NPDC049541 TaxID=3365594 RepID=UPI0037927FC9
MTTLTYAKASQHSGGDLRYLPSGLDGVLDLSTCVTRSGPSPAARAAAAAFDPASLTVHPYGVEDRFRTAYAAYLGTDPRQLVVTRGISEPLSVLASVLPADRSAALTPDYTGTIRRWSRQLPPPVGERDTVELRVQRLDSAMRRYAFVVFSNPNNPLGLTVPRDALAELLTRHPQCTLIVDEAYVDYLGDRRQSAMTLPHRNLAVLASPGKPLGIAGTRTGALWSADERLRELVARRLPEWPLSAFDAHVACAALGDAEWIGGALVGAREDARRLEAVLVGHFGDAVVTGVPVHYRFVYHERPERLHAHLLADGIATRLLLDDEPGRVRGVRVLAPGAQELARFEASLHSFTA